MRKQGFVLVVMALSALLGAGRAAEAGFGELNSYFGFTYGDSDVPADVHNVRSQQTSPDGRMVKLSGEFGPIDGARFRSGFVLLWSGDFTGMISAGDVFAADLDFDVDVTGGDLAWSYYADLRPLTGGDSARILTDLMPIPPSGHVGDVQLQSSPFTQAGEDGFYESYLHIEWTGFSPTDTLTLTIPQNSVDVTYLPEPATGLLAIAALAGFRARRQEARQFCRRPG